MRQNDVVMETKRMRTTTGGEVPSTRTGLWDLARVYLKVGATGFGGAMPILAMVHTELVQKRHWVSQEEFDEAVMVGQILPGPIVVDAATYIGYRLRGWPGAVVSVFTFFLPSFLMMLGLTLFYLQYGSAPQFGGIFRGVGAAVVALILSAAWRMGKPALKDVRSAALMAGALIGLLFFHLNVLLLVALAGAAGIALFRKPSDFPVGQKKGGQ